MASETKSELSPIAPLLEMPPAVTIEREYSGFPLWRALLVEPNREHKSADVLIRFGMMPYLPRFVKQYAARARPGGRVARLSAVVSGMLFVPIEHLDIDNRDDAFDWARVRGYLRGTGSNPAILSKAQIEIIREIEGKLNLPPPILCKGTIFKVGQRVRFVNDVYAAFWGIGAVVEVASASRIGVEVERLIGCASKVYVPASEIEAI